MRIGRGAHRQHLDRVSAQGEAGTGREGKRLKGDGHKDSGTRADKNHVRGDLMDRQTLSIMKACEVVGVSRRTIYNWISAGKVEYVRTAGGSIRIFADSLWRPSTDAQGSLGKAEGRDASAPRAGDDTSRTAGPHA